MSPSRSGQELRGYLADVGELPTNSTGHETTRQQGQSALKAGVMGAPLVAPPKPIFTFPPLPPKGLADEGRPDPLDLDPARPAWAVSRTAPGAPPVPQTWVYSGGWGKEAWQANGSAARRRAALICALRRVVLGPELSNRGELVATLLPLRWALGGSRGRSRAFGPFP